MARRCARRRREQRGAVAVEAGLVSAVLLLPLLLGTLQLGQYLWGAQRIDAVTPGVPVGLVVGVFTCDALEAEVAAAVAATVVDLGLGVDLDADDVEVQVVDVDPVVGATVQVHLEVPTTGGLASLLPLPGGGALVTDFSQRLDDVTLSEGSCG
ncbi:hypothetical protein BJ989_002689 [Nocardioides perillae]|uniref:TadE-like domain-containing protein n=1 Tax=Nocardioides perillae TaxID=1119534 RepID=A0A7Y9UVB9_9ACTN|nr:TadE/TadG family type IV pilus assembly protein [Nocardioides perillae]NYG56385.1 hypothetical protein [Nocardioides perillae]